MLNQDSNMPTIKLDYLVNTCRRFGRFGPAYQIMSIIRHLDSGDILMKVHVLESNEDIEYPLSSILNDLVEMN